MSVTRRDTDFKDSFLRSNAGASPAVRCRLAIRPYGTGSYPPVVNGLQRMILRTPSANPATSPCFRIAWTAYSEQVGWYLHIGGRSGAVF